MKQLADNAGYRLNYFRMPEGRLLEASIKLFHCDYRQIQKLMTDALSAPDE